MASSRGKTKSVPPKQPARAQDDWTNHQPHTVQQASKSVDGKKLAVADAQSAAKKPRITVQNKPVQASTAQTEILKSILSENESAAFGSNSPLLVVSNSGMLSPVPLFKPSGRSNQDLQQAQHNLQRLPGRKKAVPKAHGKKSSQEKPQQAKKTAASSGVISKTSKVPIAAPPPRDNKAKSQDASKAKQKPKPKQSKKSSAPRERDAYSSQYRGVTLHCLTCRYEAHFWDSTYVRTQSENQANKGKANRRRGRQVYLGSYTEEEPAARAYDRAALCFLGETALLNFPLSDYVADLEKLKKSDPLDVIAELRRGSVGFARGNSAFRGVTQHSENSWEARIGKVSGKRYCYLGIFSSPEDAARAYDRAAVKFIGRKATTNFKFSDYADILRDPDSYDPFEAATMDSLEHKAKSPKAGKRKMAKTDDNDGMELHYNTRAKRALIEAKEIEANKQNTNDSNLSQLSNLFIEFAAQNTEEKTAPAAATTTEKEERIPLPSPSLATLSDTCDVLEHSNTAHIPKIDQPTSSSMVTYGSHAFSIPNRPSDADLQHSLLAALNNILATMPMAAHRGTGIAGFNPLPTQPVRTLSAPRHPSLFSPPRVARERRASNAGFAALMVTPKAMSFVQDDAAP